MERLAYWWLVPLAFVGTQVIYSWQCCGTKFLTPHHFETSESEQFSVSIPKTSVHSFIHACNRAQHSTHILLHMHNKIFIDIEESSINYLRAIKAMCVRSVSADQITCQTLELLLATYHSKKRWYWIRISVMVSQFSFLCNHFNSNVWCSIETRTKHI